ncbi:MAG: ATP-binding protein [Chloroflexi bacterium]|nr:ATP-binding protein [Chloroflexota bacterium]
MKTIFDSCEPRSEVLKGELREEIFAARLRDVIVGKADLVYQDPATFFDNTYPTEGLKLLLDEALGRLTGLKPANNAIIRLETAFGGGKTHNLIALYHTAKGHRPSASLVAPSLVPAPGSIKVVAAIGSDPTPSTGLIREGIRTYTLWGEIVAQLTDYKDPDLVERSERDRAAPGTGLWEELIGDQPTLIMLDEVARHLRAAKAVPTATGKSDLAEQTVAFLMSLFEFAASRKRVMVVYTLADPQDAFGKETEELRQHLAEARRVSARQERVITPTGETEISAIVTHRLFRHIDRTAGQATAAAYGVYFQRLLDQGADLPSRAARAEYVQEMVADYPFHPELLTTLNRKTSTIPNFQKTRGALRLLARVIRRLWEMRPPDAYLIHPYHLDLAVEDIAGDLTSRLERPAFKQVIEADIVSPKVGSPAHAQVIDAPWLEAGKPPYAQRTATTTFLHSLTRGIATGVDPADLALAVVQPDDDPTLVAKAAERLYDIGWFFDWDGRRYRFKTEPSLNKIVTDEMGLVGRTRAKAELDGRIRQVWKKGYLQPVYFPSEAGDVDDDADKPKLAIIHYDAATSNASADAPPDLVRKIFDHAGSLEGYRRFRNNVLFLVADEEQVENMVQVAQRYLAIGRITGDAERMAEFHEEQRKKLKKIGEAAELDVRVAITKAYKYLYYPSGDAPQRHSNLARETLPPQDQGEVNQDQSNVVLRVLKQLQKALTADDPTLPAAFVKAKAWDAGQVMISTEDLRRAFARRMGLRILLDLNQLKKTIRNGVSQGIWVYYDTAEQIGYGKPSPAPLVQISEEVMLYAPEEARRLRLRIKGEEDGGNGPEPTCPVCHRPASQCICGQVCPRCGQDPCICERRVRLHAEGAPAQAFQGLLDQCHDGGVTGLSRLSVRIEGEDKEGATETRALGLAVPQLGKGQFRIEQSFNAEFGEDESLSLAFNGDWDRYKRLKQVTDTLGQEASKLSARTTLRADFPEGLAVGSDQFQTIHEVFTTLGFGHMVLDAEPFEKEYETRS